MPRAARSSRRWLLFACAFLFRLGYGLTLELFSEDETQIYLMGLRYHATHHWPYFGPDVVWTRSEIPGALQALVVGLPIDVLPIPEAPYILLTLLSTSALWFFASYLSARLPSLPRWLLYGWLLTLPWTLNYSTHIMNPSYVLPASLLFFAGFFEACPPLAIGRIRVPMAHALMGAAIGWIAQVHMSWPLLLPFAGLAFFGRFREGARSIGIAVASFIGGLLVTTSVLIPTFVAYGLFQGAGGTADNITITWREPFSTVLTAAARFLAFASYEVARFIATGSPRQIVLLWRHTWLIPAAAIVWLAGIAHPLWMFLTAFRRASPRPEWPLVRWLAVGAVMLVSASFYLVVQPTQARMYYLMAPMAFIYAAYCWTFVDSPRWRRVAAFVLVVNALFQIGLAVIRFPTSSLYQHRDVVQAAISLKEPDLFGHRRPYARDVPPEDLAAAIIGADAPGDLQVVNAVTKSRSATSFRGISRSRIDPTRSPIAISRVKPSTTTQPDARWTSTWSRCGWSCSRARASPSCSSTECGGRARWCAPRSGF